MYSHLSLTGKPKGAGQTTFLKSGNSTSFFTLTHPNTGISGWNMMLFQLRLTMQCIWFWDFGLRTQVDAVGFIWGFPAFFVQMIAKLLCICQGNCCHNVTPDITPGLQNNKAMSWQDLTVSASQNQSSTVSVGCFHVKTAVRCVKLSVIDPALRELPGNKLSACSK